MATFANLMGRISGCFLFTCWSAICCFLPSLLFLLLNFLPSLPFPSFFFPFYLSPSFLLSILSSFLELTYFAYKCVKYYAFINFPKFLLHLILYVLMFLCSKDILFWIPNIAINIKKLTCHSEIR